QFLDDLCTIKEVLDISQRLSVAFLLDAKESYLTIREKTGVSTATISRVSKCYEYGAGGYRMVIDLLKKKNAESAGSGTPENGKPGGKGKQ
ncbi:MAG: YerC/YecD family TrpR-related protein, partial [Clostridia bacterium]|nr:YerC/YecD family TrpR-related protein [Clostridia bacterium]